MRRFASFLSRLAATAGARPVPAAALFVLICFGYALLSGLPPLQNDDIQIQFLLLNGGEGPQIHSLYLHPLLTNSLALLTDWLPAYSWYYAALMLTATAAGFCLMSVLLPIACSFPENREKTRFFAWTRWLWFAFAFYYLTQLFGQIQHTYVAIYAALTAVTLAADAAIHGGAWKKYAAFLLWVAALAFRFDAWQAGFLLAVFLGIVFVSDSKRRQRLRRYLTLTACMALAGGILYVARQAVDAASPEWKEARAFNIARTVINDSPDNSGLDKSDAWAKLHLSPTDVALLKAFIYSPAWDGLGKKASDLDEASSIHRQGREGIFGDSLTARLGFFKLKLSTLTRLAPDAVAATPYIPLLCMVAAFLLFPNRRRRPLVAATLGFLIVYLGLLLAVDRPVIRVYLPAVALSALLTGSCLPTQSENRDGRRIRTALLLILGLGSLLVTFRHYRHKNNAAPHTEAMIFCRNNPDARFFSLSLQSAPGLYPQKFCSHPLEHWKNGNVIPVGDGWMFYTPVYRRYLKERRIDDPYLALTKENAFLVTYVTHEKERVFHLLRSFYKERYGIDVTFRLEACAPPCRFWRVQTGTTSPTEPQTP